MAVQDGANTEDDLTMALSSNSDARLQASRRVDWRFLLPDPRLGRVAYIGSASENLLDALHQFSDSLSLLETLDTTGDLYDLVVVCEPSHELLRAASGAVKPGGALYAEFAGRWYRPDDHIGVLKQAGCAKVQAYWHWPSVEKCTKLIPLHNPSALRLALIKGRIGSVPRIETVLLQGLYRTRLLRLGIRHFSLVAERGNV